MPVFTDSTLFPTFHSLPPASSPSSSIPADSGEANRDWFLLAQIKEDMTITKPTVIVRDRSGTEFAVTFDDGDHRGMGLKFRKGHTLVVPRATRTDRDDGKKAIVRVPQGQGAGVRIVPGGLEQVLELGEVLAGIEGAEAEVEAEVEGQVKRRKKCGACGEMEKEGQTLMRCTGCGAAAYCSKECQVRGWSEMGHKANCKVIRSIKEIWH
ncbi:hypothetical protein M434DRAFT_398312 [Hypoxylon sp. CO27-5]|nr:hypothetical protein M434DRAFT_398312 [Hypoxylon sp. CO27-5]